MKQNMKRVLASALMMALSLGLAASARAEERRLSLFDYAYKGLALGAGVGLAGGYLVAREDGWNRSDWKPLAYGAGIGALAGAGIGLTLGVVDVTQSKPSHKAHYILRDMGLGAAFGFTVGAIAGGLAAISTEKVEHVLFGGAIGVLAGAGVGGILGIFDGPDKGEHAAAQQPFGVSIVPVLEANGQLAYLPSLSGRY
jgi:hypothetical protein